MLKSPLPVAAVDLELGFKWVGSRNVCVEAELYVVLSIIQVYGADWSQNTFVTLDIIRSGRRTKPVRMVVCMYQYSMYCTYVV